MRQCPDLRRGSDVSVASLQPIDLGAIDNIVSVEGVSEDDEPILGDKHESEDIEPEPTKTEDGDTS